MISSYTSRHYRIGAARIRDTIELFAWFIDISLSDLGLFDYWYIPCRANNRLSAAAKDKRPY